MRGDERRREATSGDERRREGDDKAVRGRRRSGGGEGGKAARAARLRGSSILIESRSNAAARAGSRHARVAAIAATCRGMCFVVEVLGLALTRGSNTCTRCAGRSAGHPQRRLRTLRLLVFKPSSPRAVHARTSAAVSDGPPSSTRKPSAAADFDRVWHAMAAQTSTGSGRHSLASRG